MGTRIAKRDLEAMRQIEAMTDEELDAEIRLRQKSIECASANTKVAALEQRMGVLERALKVRSGRVCFEYRTPERFRRHGYSTAYGSGWEATMESPKPNAGSRHWQRQRRGNNVADFDNGLIPAEVERLAILAEEAAEVIQIVGKILRHGYTSHNPVVMAPISNRGLLAKEIGDLRWIITLMISEGDVAEGAVLQRERLKIDSAKPYLHHQRTEERHG